jgi:hypothetical protein
MATSIEGKIAEALFGRLASLSLSPALPFAWPNVTFSPPAGVYLAVALLRNSTDRLTVENDGPHRHQGIMQVTVDAPLNVGETGLLDIGGQIADHFPSGLRLNFDGGHLHVTKRPDVVSLKDDDNARWLVPVSVFWAAFV